MHASQQLVAVRLRLSRACGLWRRVVRARLLRSHVTQRRLAARRLAEGSRRDDVWHDEILCVENLAYQAELGSAHSLAHMLFAHAALGCA